jgi:serine/threonine-protein kinase
MLDGERTLDNRYALNREIHRGERCTVYQAKHLFTSRTVAVKLLNPDLVEDAMEREALLGEARLLSEIRHVAIPDVLDAGMVSGEKPGTVQPYIVMEMIEGRSLAGLLAARGVLEVPLAVMATQALAAALRACHKKGLVHQDVRPANMLLPLERAHREPETRGAPVKLVDFDAAMRSLLRDGAAEDRSYHPYLAPEQQHGGQVDPRTDIFGAGVVLYQCLTGELPYPLDGSFRERAKPPSQHRSEVPKRLDDVVLQAIATNITVRFETMDELVDALTKSLREPSVPPLSQAPPSLVPAPSTDDGASRRRFARAAYMTPVRIIRGEDTVIDCTCEDISEGGMQLYGASVTNEGEELRARFALPISGKIVEVRSIARWHKDAHDGEGATGIEFAELSGETREEIAKYVQYFASE